jgi:hypothetical protein
VFSFAVVEATSGSTKNETNPQRVQAHARNSRSLKNGLEKDKFNAAEAFPSFSISNSRPLQYGHINSSLVLIVGFSMAGKTRRVSFRNPRLNRFPTSSRGLTAQRPTRQIQLQHRVHNSAEKAWERKTLCVINAARNYEL